MPSLADVVVIALIVFMSVMLIGIVWLFQDSVGNNQRGRIAYLKSPPSLCLPIIENCITRYIADPSKMRTIEAGAGNAYVSRFLASNYRWKEVIAVEISAVRILLARFGNIFQRAPVRFVRANVFAYKYPVPALIYCYLSPDIMQRLYKKGSFSGCLVLSLSFAIPGVTATEEIPLPNWQKRFLVYDFRPER